MVLIYITRLLGTDPRREIRFALAPAPTSASSVCPWTSESPGKAGGSGGNKGANSLQQNQVSGPHRLEDSVGPYTSA